MSTAVSKRHDNVVDIIKTNMRRAGLWTTPQRLVYWLAKTAQICFLILLVTQTITLYLTTGDTAKLFECFSLVTFCGISFLKLKSLTGNHVRWQRLLDHARRLEYELSNNTTSGEEYDSDGEENSPNNIFVTEIQTYTAQYRALDVALNRIYYFTLVVFITSPFIEYVYRIISGLEVGRPHVLPGWAPLEEISFYGYLITVIAEVLAAIYCVVIHTVFDATVFGMMIFISGQFSLLRNYSQHLAGSGNHLLLLSARDKRAHYRIRKCHRILVLLDEIFSELNNLIQSILGIYFFVVTLTLCSVAVRLSTEVLPVLQVVALVQYTGASLTQLFLFCYYGDMVFQKSSTGICEGPFAAALWCLSPRLRRELFLLAAGMARGRSLRAGPFNYLDFPSFIQIVRTAYSYYAVLRKQ